MDSPDDADMDGDEGSEGDEKEDEGEDMEDDELGHVFYCDGCTEEISVFESGR